MLLGDTSVTALWMMFIGAFILGGTFLYDVMKAGRLRRSERVSSTEAQRRRSVGTPRRKELFVSNRRFGKSARTASRISSCYRTRCVTGPRSFTARST
jgi:hypothetical protein